MTIKINPRQVAAEALCAIASEGAYNNRILHTLLRQNGAMSPKDRAFVTEIVNGTLRQIIYIDYVLDAFSSLPHEKMKPWVLAVLRSGIYQILFLQVPDSAACNESVKLMGLRGSNHFSGFVNGVLRAVSRGKEEIKLPQEGTAEYLSIRYSHPLWLVKMWLAAYSYDFVEALCAADQCAPDVTIRVNTQKTTKEDLKTLLETSGVSVQDSLFCPNALHLSGTAGLAHLKAFQDGLFHVQDESAQLSALLLGVQKGERILDVCAAPGGKSFLAAEEMEDTGSIVSCDLYPHKIDLIAEGAQRLGLESIHAQLRDGTQVQENEKSAFDRVLADVPCSGFGLLRKKPDLRLHRDGTAIDQLLPIQWRILQASADCVKKGGVLVYSTCTLCKKENEGMIRRFLSQREDFIPEDLTALLPSGISCDTAKDGFVTLYPHIHGTDGFFIARLRRKE